MCLLLLTDQTCVASDSFNYNSIAPTSSLEITIKKYISQIYAMKSIVREEKDETKWPKNDIRQNYGLQYISCNNISWILRRMKKKQLN